MMMRAFLLKRLLWPEQVDGAETMRKRWARKLEEDARVLGNAEKKLDGSDDR